MAKRVLGDDPFAQQAEKPADETAGAKKSVAPAASARESKKPAAPSSRASKRPSTAAPASRAPSSSSSSSARASRAPTRAAAPSKAPARRDDGDEAVAQDEPSEHAAALREARVPPAPRAPSLGDDAPAAAPPLFDEAAEHSTVAADLPPDVARAARSPAPELHAEEPARAVARPVARDAVEDQIRDLESQLDQLLGKVAEKGADRATLDRVAERLRARMDARGGGGGGASARRGDEGARGSDAPPGAPHAGGDEGAVFDVARELLSSDYAARQWGRVALRDRATEVDEFGLDPKYAARVRPFFDFLYERWWRVEAHDIDHVPADGRVILCANHSGALPYDGAMLATALRREHPAHRELRWLAEDFVFHFPFLGVFMNRIGAVRACQENAERLLKKATCVGVFPEGVKGIAKLFRDRYKLQRFGRGGHVKLAIRTRTPIVPVAIVGAEEASPLIAPTQLLAKALGVPYVPITPTFPWLGPAGLLPLPSKWKIFFLEPISVEQYAPDQADDDVLVGRLNEKIRAMIQDQLDRAVRARRSVFRG